MIFKLVRLAQIDGTTLGVLFQDSGGPLEVFKTIEPAWRNNNKNISCVPEARYLCRRVQSSFGRVWQLMAVPDRSEILIHAGNTAEDTRGCILIGKQFGKLNSLPAVLESKIALNRFHEITKDFESFELLIINTVELM